MLNDGTNKLACRWERVGRHVDGVAHRWERVTVMRVSGWVSMHICRMGGCRWTGMCGERMEMLECRCVNASGEIIM